MAFRQKKILFFLCDFSWELIDIGLAQSTWKTVKHELFPIMMPNVFRFCLSVYVFVLMTKTLKTSSSCCWSNLWLTFVAFCSIWLTAKFLQFLAKCVWLLHFLLTFFGFATVPMKGCSYVFAQISYLSNICQFTPLFDFLLTQFSLWPEMFDLLELNLFLRSFESPQLTFLYIGFPRSLLYCNLKCLTSVHSFHTQLFL